jgi:hypothetical protein
LTEFAEKDYLRSFTFNIYATYPQIENEGVQS